MLTALMALANPAHAWADEACSESSAPSSSHSNSATAGTPTSHSDESADDSPQGAVDLGDQPVLLLHQAFKPIPQTTPDPTDHSAVVSVGEGRAFFVPVHSQRTAGDDPIYVYPRHHAGVSLMPHGPPHVSA